MRKLAKSKEFWPSFQPIRLIARRENAVFNVGINFAGLWLLDTQFLNACAQRAAVKSKDFCSPAMAAYFPMGLLK